MISECLRNIKSLIQSFKTNKVYESKCLFYSTYGANSRQTTTSSSSASNDAKEEKKHANLQLNKVSKFTTASNQHLQQSQKVKYSNDTLNENSFVNIEKIATANVATTDTDKEISTYKKSASNESHAKLPQKIKKKSDWSESRERFNNIRYFYADPEIDKAAEKPLIRLNPMTMFYMGVSDDNSHLLQSANCKFI